ncbi:MAG: hypothetical protein WA014_02135 [Minisyncoccia bacterium]
MDILITVGKLLLVFMAVATVAQPIVAQRHNYEFVWQVFKRFRFGLFFQAFGVLLIVIIVGVALTYVPLLKYGWTNLFGISGNILVVPVQEGSRSSIELVRMLPVLFFVVMMFVLPFLAKAEEEMFRKGHEEWKDIAWQSFKFGLVHCFVGVPLAFGIALSIAGLFYGWKYKREFTRKVTTKLKRTA